MKGLKLCLIGLLSCFALQTQAANWVLVAQNSQNAISVDTLSIRTSNQAPNDFWFWAKYDKSATETNRTGVFYELMFERVSCQTNMYGILEITSYFINGTSHSESFNNSPMMPIRPESAIDVVAKYICTTFTSIKH